MAPATPTMPQQQQHQTASSSANDSPHPRDSSLNHSSSSAHLYRPSAPQFNRESPQSPVQTLPQSKSVNRFHIPARASPLSSSKPAKTDSNGWPRASPSFMERGSYRDAAHATQDPRRPSAASKPSVSGYSNRSSATSQPPSAEDVSCLFELPNPDMSAAEDFRRRYPEIEDARRRYLALQEARRSGAAGLARATKEARPSSAASQPSATNEARPVATKEARPSSAASQPSATNEARPVATKEARPSSASNQPVATKEARTLSASNQPVATKEARTLSASNQPVETKEARPSSAANQPPATEESRRSSSASLPPATKEARPSSAANQPPATEESRRSSSASLPPATKEARPSSASTQPVAAKEARRSNAASQPSASEDARRSTAASQTPASEGPRHSSKASLPSATEESRLSSAATQKPASEEARRSTAARQPLATEEIQRSIAAVQPISPQPLSTTANTPSKAVRIKLKVPVQASSDQSPSETAPATTASTSSKPDAPKKGGAPEAQASGTPVSPDFSSLSFDELIRDNRFAEVERVSVLDTPPEQLSRYITEVVEEAGVPVILSDLHKLSSWDANLFRPGTYQRSSSETSQSLQVRNLSDWRDWTMTVEDLLNHCRNNKNYGSTEKDRLYGRDLACPSAWQEKIASLVHPRLVYHGEEDVAASLNRETRVETQMCYFGSGNTFAPLRRELCSSYGQNLMVWSDVGAGSIWIITQSDDSDKVDEFIRASGGDPDAECFAVHPNALQGLPFPIFCCKQQVGDLVLIPSGATRQVINVHGRTMKVAWSRLSIDTLETALHVDLPMYQRICRKETYRIKAVVEATLTEFTASLRGAADASDMDAIPDLLHDLRRVLNMYDQILSDEYVSDWREHKVEGDVDSYVECDFCGADVLLSYFECPSEHTLCSLCYCQGRLCPCNTPSALRPRQLYLPFDKRLGIRNAAASLIKSFGETDSDQPSIEVVNEKEVKKTSWPHSFMAACRLYNLRLSVKSEPKQASCKMCNSSVNKTTGYKCKPCHSWFCFGCLLHRTYIHPVHVLAQSNAGQFHNYHESFSSKDYAEWKENPTVYFVEAQVHFAHIEAGITRTSCVPLNIGCKMGFLDTSPEYPYGYSGTLGRPHNTHSRSITLGKRSLEATQSPASSPQPSSASHKRAKLMPSSEAASSSPKSSGAGASESIVPAAKATDTSAVSRTPGTGPKGKATTITIIDDDDSPSTASPSLARKAAVVATEKTAALMSGSKGLTKGVSSTEDHSALPPSALQGAAAAQKASTEKSAMRIETGMLPSSPEGGSTAVKSVSSAKAPSANMSMDDAVNKAGSVSNASFLASASPTVAAHTAAAASLLTPTTAPTSSRERSSAPAASLPAVNGTTTPINSSLLLLDSKSLKILSEILGIFSKDVNQRGSDRHQKVVRKLEQGAGKDEEILQEIRGYRAEQQEILQTMQQLLQRQQEAKAREDERHAQMAAQIAELQDAIGDLTGDITRGAQARLEIETRQADYNVSKSLEDPSTHLHRTSNIRSKPLKPPFT